MRRECLAGSRHSYGDLVARDPRGRLEPLDDRRWERDPPDAILAAEQYVALVARSPARDLRNRPVAAGGDGDLGRVEPLAGPRELSDRAGAVRRAQIVRQAGHAVSRLWRQQRAGSFAVAARERGQVGAHLSLRAAVRGCILGAVASAA